MVITPTLQIKMSSWVPDCERKVLAPGETELSDVWSRVMKVRFGEKDVTEVMSVLAASVLRPVK